jgi:hypothetical protein
MKPVGCPVEPQRFTGQTYPTDCHAARRATGGYPGTHWGSTAHPTGFICASFWHHLGTFLTPDHPRLNPLGKRKPTEDELVLKRYPNGRLLCTAIYIYIYLFAYFYDLYVFNCKRVLLACISLLSARSTRLGYLY